MNADKGERSYVLFRLQYCALGATAKVRSTTSSKTGRLLAKGIRARNKSVLTAVATVFIEFVSVRFWHPSCFIGDPSVQLVFFVLVRLKIDVYE